MPFFKNFGFVLFAIIAITDISFLAADLARFRFYTKPFLLPVLLITILANTSDQRHPVSKFFLVVAFVAGALGDFFLLKAQYLPDYFGYGLQCFLVMQFIYCLYFFRMQPLKKSFVVVNIFVASLLIGYAFLLIGILYKFLGDLKVPVIFYTAVITLMFFSAINVYNSKRAQKLALRYFIPGAGLLVLSDSVLAFNKFFFKEDLFNISIMVTYILGQTFLTIGFIKHLKSRKPSKRRRARPGTEDELAAG